MTNDLNGYMGISINSNGQNLVAVQRRLLSSIWLAPEGNLSLAKEISTDKTSDVGTWTPDGKLVYESRADSHHNIWIMDQDGSNQKRLTTDENTNYHPCVTSEGRAIVFSSHRDGVPNIWRMNLDGSETKQLTRGQEDHYPKCSPDGRWVIYAAGGSARKVPAEGGESSALGPGIESCTGVSPDGKFVACNYLEGQGPSAHMKIAVVPIDGGVPLQTFEFAPPGKSIFSEIVWTRDGTALTYELGSSLWIQPLSGGPPRQLSDFKADRIFSLDWSPDGKQLAVVRGNITSDVVLISSFR